MASIPLAILASVEEMLLGVSPELVQPVPTEHAESWQNLFLRVTGRNVEQCPACKVGRMGATMEIPPEVTPWRLPARGAAS